MNKISDVMKHNQFLKRLVLDRETVEDQGRVTSLWLNLQSHQVIGFTCKSDFFSRQKKNFVWEQIDTVGTDAILVNRNVESDNLEKPDNIVNIIGNEVWTDSGEKTGIIVEYLINLKTGSVVNYLFKFNSWKSLCDSIYLLPPEAVFNAGSKRVIVAKEALENPQIYTKKNSAKIDKVQLFLEADLQRTKEHINLARSEAIKLAIGFQARAKSVKEQAQETAQVVAKQAKQKVEEFHSKSLERKDKIQFNSDEFNSKLQQVTSEAKEKIDGVKFQWQNSSTTVKDE
ncbi:MAG: PRC-barrel domain-containing protein [Microcoleaceae cyanobacterium MO_207.B10]|nr:PRC-barrel domain-containing protein [Microcoleaceae cyanobacterium MO_207.B10]